MKSFFKTAFFIAFVLIFVSCGEKKSVYSQYPDPSDSESDVPAADNDGTKTDCGTESGEDAASDSDKIDDTDISGGGTPVSDEDIPADSDNPADDEDTAETDGDSSETDGDTEELLNCTGFSLDPDDKLSGWLPSTIYTIKIEGNILGNTDYEDFLEIRLDHKRVDGDPYVAAGTYDLAYGYNGHNTNSWRCWECVSATQDRQRDSEKFYFQKSGTLIIESVDSKYNFKGTLSAVLAESELDAYGVSSPVVNGDCIEIETYFEAETFCSPDCSGKENGESDGCGGFCGEGCGETEECQSNRECDPGYYCGNDCHCYIENPED